ncbi:MAG: TetR/AcrR family transcriptional regulator [Gammaproteobacteria bacterium]|nr:TetR/AcrR family transcriptional regulator [Gammaproteobacteria bacterium]
MNRLRGRPRGFKIEKALDAALELFWKQGYSNTTTRELETNLGLSQSSIYNTFGCKRDLLAAALDRYEAITDRELLGPLEQSDKGLASIETFFDALQHWVTHQGRRGCMLINMMAEDGGETDAIAKRARSYRTRVRNALRDALVRAVKDGETADNALEDRADLLLGLVLGLNIAARARASDAELRTLFDAVRTQIRSWALVEPVS